MSFRDQNENRITDYLFVLLQYLLPHHLLSWLMHRVAGSEWKLLKNWIIQQVIRLYQVDMNLAHEPNPERYPSFNAFFTRALRPDARPFSPDMDTVLCPADGAISQAGHIEQGRIFQAKGRAFSLVELLGGQSQWCDQFQGGSFATIYLSPRDYHRVHVPLEARLKQMIHVPGRLFSVNPVTTRLVPRLFSRNERVISLFETAAGPMVVIMVGAIFVASLDTVWAGTVAPRYRQVRRFDYGMTPATVQLERGQEMGRFNMGSTVILLFGRDAVEWRQNLEPGSRVKMGEELGRTRKS